MEHPFVFILIVSVIYWSDIVTYPARYILDKFEDWCDDLEKKRRKKKFAKATVGMDKEELNDYRKSLRKPYRTIEDLFDESDIKDRKDPSKLMIVLGWIERNLWWTVLEHPENLRYNLIHLYQRGKRGWSYRDVWHLNGHIAEVLIESIKYLKKVKRGIPESGSVTALDIGMEDDKEWNKAMAEYDGKLDIIVRTFETAKGISEENVLYQKSSDYDYKLAKYWKDTHKKWLKRSPHLYDKDKLKVLTKKECKEYEAGWVTLQENFFGLRD
jgi:hypothetical protein